MSGPRGLGDTIQICLPSQGYYRGTAPLSRTSSRSPGLMLVALVTLTQPRARWDLGLALVGPGPHTHPARGASNLLAADMGRRTYVTGSLSPPSVPDTVPSATGVF